ncbi:MAG: hypothetical protein E7181_02245 [Erysipelotrichaceae bacterium]|nr:hypothetical protein [Erysipelotrichaceae bacterium]
MTVGLGVGITYAASYVSPDDEKVIQLGSMESSDYNFQNLAYYFGGGTGVDNSHPLLINNSYQLRNFSKLQNSGAFKGQTYYFALGTSFQYEGSVMEPIGNASYPFTGTFNGNNFAITGLNVATSTALNVGMFGEVGNSGAISDFVLIGPSVSYTGSGAINIGIVAGSVHNSSTVQNIAIYGGTTSFDKFRAKIITIGSPTITTNGAVVGSGSTTNVGFVGAISSTPSYSPVYVYSGSPLQVNKTNKLYLNDTTVALDVANN